MSREKLSREQLIVGLLAVVLLSSGAALRAAEPQAKGDTLLGKWWFPKKNGQMEIYREGDKYFGKVISYDKPEQLDEKNPDPQLQSRKFVGILMVQDFTYDAEEARWIDGTIYDADSGKTYSCNMWYKDGDPGRLNVRGYVGLAILGRTEIFTRVTKEDEEKAAKLEAEKKKTTDATEEQDTAEEGDKAEEKKAE